MTFLTINSTENGTIIFRDKSLSTVWYELIRQIGMPVDTDGQVIDSIEGLKANQGENGVACFTKQSINYRTNKVWFTIRTK